MVEMKEGIEIVKNMLIAIGEDPDREGLADTPERIVRMWREVFVGYDPSKKPKITVFKNHSDGIDYDELITDSGEFCSFCEHHALAFRGSYDFAYIPDEHVIGLSKVARIIDYYSARLQVQERLTKQIVDELETILKPKAIGLILRASHECKEIRGAKKHGSMTTSVMRGLFRSEPETRAEFLQLTTHY